MVILAKAEIGKFGVVLRYSHNAVHPYWTHEFRVDKPNCTYTGYYFTDKDDAFNDFIERQMKLNALAG